MGSSSSSKKFVATTQREAGDVLGVGARQVADYLSRGCPGRAKNYPIPEMIAWCKEHIWNRHAIELADGDEMLVGDGGGKSAPLERYRDERAKMARLDRMEREGQLIPREKVHEGLQIFAEAMHRGLEQIQSDFPEAAKILHESLDEIEQAYRDRFGEPDSFTQ